jgi:hypothetical protein
LHFEEVHADGTDWSDKLNPDGIVVTVGSWNQELEGVETEHDGGQAKDGWDQQFSVIFVGWHEVVVGDGPHKQGDQLEYYNSSISYWVVWNLL